MSSYYCERCGKLTELLSIKEVSYYISVSRRTVYNWIERGNLHLLETPGGRTLICKGSLLQPDRRLQSDS